MDKVLQETMEVRILEGEPYRTKYLAGKIGTIVRQEIVAGEERYWVRFPVRPPAHRGDEYWFLATELQPTGTVQVL